MPTLIEVQKASRAAESLNTSVNQWVVKPGGGHSRMFAELNARIAMTISGM